jgi:Calcium-activated chloride channel
LIAVVITLANSYWWDLYDSPLNSLYSIFVVLWASLFVIFWNRRCRGLHVEWDNQMTKDQDDDVRKEFEGTWLINPLTDKLEPMKTESLIRYLKSCWLCLPYFLTVAGLNIIFLNLTGIVDPTRHHALFQIEFLSDLCKPGNILDLTGNLSILPPIVQTVISILLDLRFKKVAYHATEVENHRT